MPSPHQYVEKAASVLHTNGNLLAFNPSITQIISIVKTVKHLGLPLVLDSFLELGLNVSGGKDWVSFWIYSSLYSTAPNLETQDIVREKKLWTCFINPGFLHYLSNADSEMCVGCTYCYTKGTDEED